MAYRALPVETPETPQSRLEAYARHTRYMTFATWVAVIILGTMGVIGMIYGISDRGIHIDEDSFTNDVESRVVEVLLGSEGNVVCSGVFIRATGEILTAAHCFFEGESVCSFDTTIPAFPLAPFYTYFVEVMGVNGTRDKWTFPAEVVAISGITDIIILKVMIPISPSLCVSSHMYFPTAPTPDAGRRLSHQCHQPRVLPMGREPGAGARRQRARAEL
jgi:hypothetical protein